MLDSHRVPQGYRLERYDEETGSWDDIFYFPVTWPTIFGYRRFLWWVWVTERPDIGNKKAICDVRRAAFNKAKFYFRSSSWRIIEVTKNGSEFVVCNNGVWNDC